jgi:copper chaperone CopZ
VNKQTVVVEGMHCGGCANSVKTKFEAISGVSQVEMDLENKTAFIKADHLLTADELNVPLAETTYEVVEVK